MPRRLESPPPDHFRENRLFTGIPAELIDELREMVERRRFKPGDVIFREGDPGDCLYLVCEGTVRISKAGRGGNQETLGFIEAGNFFGEMALIDGEPRSAQATAVEECVLARIHAGDFDKIWDHAPRNSHLNFLRCQVERLRGTNAHFIEELLRNERLALVGTMANSIIHDLNNPMMVIRSCAEMIAGSANDPKIENLSRLMLKAASRIANMTQELLDFARGQSSLQPQRVPVKHVLEEIDGEVSRLAPQNVSLVREYKDAGEIVVDAGRFARMLTNLVKNAVEAMPDGGVLKLMVERVDGRVIFRVSDTGRGIPPELQARIFEPFVTIGKSKGTGLGLAIAKNVVEAHGGEISLTSTPGAGTTFTVMLPAAA